MSIHSVDRAEHWCEALGEERWASQGRTLSFFIQINTGAEAQKAGIAPSADADCVPREGAACLRPGLDFRPDVHPARRGRSSSPHFALPAKIAARNGLNLYLDGHERRLRNRHRVFGATHVRVGTALFGARNY